MHYTKVVILTFSIGIGLVAHAQQTPQKRVDADMAAGKELYRQHCSVCHGLDAKGKGSLHDPLSGDKSVRVPPADLTVLSERNAGKFPADRVRDAIHSKGPIPAHGTPDMPAWGDVFYSLKYNQTLLDARVRNLTAYIEALQAAAK